MDPTQPPARSVFPLTSSVCRTAASSSRSDGSAAVSKAQSGQQKSSYHRSSFAAVSLSGSGHPGGHDRSASSDHSRRVDHVTSAKSATLVPSRPRTLISRSKTHITGPSPFRSDASAGLARNRDAKKPDNAIKSTDCRAHEANDGQRDSTLSSYTDNDQASTSTDARWHNESAISIPLRKHVSRQSSCASNPRKPTVKSEPQASARLASLRLPSSQGSRVSVAEAFDLSDSESDLHEEELTTIPSSRTPSVSRDLQEPLPLDLADLPAAAVADDAKPGGTVPDETGISNPVARATLNIDAPLSFKEAKPGKPLRTGKTRKAANLTGLLTSRDCYSNLACKSEDDEYKPTKQPGKAKKPKKRGSPAKSSASREGKPGSRSKQKSSALKQGTEGVKEVNKPTIEPIPPPSNVAFLPRRKGRSSKLRTQRRQTVLPDLVSSAHVINPYSRDCWDSSGNSSEEEVCLTSSDAESGPDDTRRVLDNIT